MSELIVPTIGTLLGCFSGGIFTYIMAKRMLSDEKILDKLDMILDEYTHDENSMRKIYMVGGILGKGLRDGMGIDRMLPKKKGVGLEGLIFDLLGNVIGKRFGVQQEEQPQQEVISPEKQIERPWR
jgi:hypothetical protein